MSKSPPADNTTGPSSDDLRELAYESLDHWGLSGSLSLIKERENSVYAFQDGDQRFALRVHRFGYHSDQSLASEHLWVRQLANSGISVPKAIPTVDGNDFAKVSTDKIADPRQVDLMAWIEGEQIGSVESGVGADGGDVRAIYQTMGRVAAQIHNQATQWKVPDDFERHSWDENGLLGERPFWGKFWELSALDAEQRALINRARDALWASLSAFRKTSDNYSMIHADFAPENFLIHGDKVQVIDFDDAGFGWHLFELATALYFIQEENCYDDAKAGLIEGYREQRTLLDDDIARLPVFLAARSLTYLGWVHERPESETAIELTPMLVELCCKTLRSYLTSNE